jgi:DNA-directed RNA polymerase specialized sigma24 family protein
VQGAGQESGTAEQLLAVVRVHADRVHDAVRRLGCPPGAALGAVEDSALDLLEETADGPLSEPVGRWFALARERAATSPGGSRSPGGAPPPVGEGVLAADGEQARLGAALAALPERERFALLLRDSYDLPVAAVAAALGTTQEQALEEVRAARLAVLPRIDRLSEAPSDAEERAARLLGGLVVVALPEAERAALLGRVERAARHGLPTAATSLGSRVVEVEHPVRRERVLGPAGVLVGLVLAAAVGVGAGLLLGRSPGAIPPAEAAGDQPLVTAPPLPHASPASAQQKKRAASPPPATTRLFTIAPTPSPTPTPTPTASPPPTLSAAVLSTRPAGGPNGAEITVTGRGWTPGKPVTVLYLDATGTATGSSAAATPGPDGSFTTTLASQDPQNLPGPHEVRATNGSQQASGSYDAAA